MTQNLSKSIKTVALLITLVLFSAFSTNSTATKIDIFDAIKAKTISATMLSNGKHSGNSVDIKITNLTSQPIELLVPAGSKYSTEADDEQTLIQLEDQFIALQPKQVYTGKVAAFCTEASDRCPTTASAMKLTKNTNPKFTALSEYIKGKVIDKSTFQDAVWAISDGYSVSNIAAEDQVSVDFRKKVAEITGQKNPWFSSPQNVTIDDRGNFNMETVLIAGQLEFICNKGTMVHQDIYKANGEAVLISDKTMQARYGNVRYRFQMQVKGWEKGEYYIKLHDGTNEITRYNFSV
ncbi:MAG: hypothetical protein NWQ27_06255 [Crocinitomicaceae bacterium]|jgi:hypothetical protein|nr:hypothetical protein [Crocinitomicaceae bacterium]